MTAHKSGDPTTLNRLYGRAKGKPLRAFQQSLVEDLLPQIAVPTEGPITAERLFGEPRPLHFEIGFGGGEHMAQRADMLPDHGFIGCEPFLNGVASALAHVHGDAAKPGIPNVRIHHGDALEVLARIPDGALSFVYLLHPDPWPKARHAKRRMMNKGPVDPHRRQAETRRRVPLRHRSPVYLRHALMVMNAAGGFPVALRQTRGLPEPPRRLARNALRSQGPQAGPRGVVLPFQATVIRGFLAQNLRKLAISPTPSYPAIS
jgi:tRNA (guanine-N7-)-methyltransferase